MSDHSFPPSHRLLHSWQFDAVFKQAEFRISRSEILVLAKRNSEGFNRLGMVISKKNFPKAVTRNAVKRRIREAFRHLTPAEVSLDVVVLGRRQADLQSFGNVANRVLNELAQRPAKPSC